MTAEGGRTRVFAHTADVGLEISAGSLEGLLVQAARGFARLATRRPRSAVRRHVPVSIAAATDPEALLVDWLNFLVYLLETERLAPVKADLEIRREAGPGGGLTLRGTLVAGPVAPGEIKLGVKGATYHGLEITRSKKGLYRARVILDI